MTVRAWMSTLAVLMAVTACRGQQSGSEQPPAADTLATVPIIEQPSAGPADSASSDSIATAATHESGGAASQAGVDTGFVGTTEPIHRGRRPPPVAILSQVRAGEHAGYDRLVFEFESDPLPGYHLEYATGPVHQCGSGDEVSVSGVARLIIRLEAAQAHDERGNVTIAERQRVLALPNVKELRLVCDFEAQVEWVAGLAARMPYRVIELSEPPRLVVDVKN